MQQKLMMYGMPLLFGGFSLVFPAGLTLYIFTNTMLTAGHHLWLHKTEEKKHPPKPAVTEGGGVTGASAKSVDADDDDDGDSGEAGSESSKTGNARQRPRRSNTRKRSKKKRRSGRA
jgi:membrane protein insertase Oxa1/YidC/SpoIIIJ